VYTGVTVTLVFLVYYRSLKTTQLVSESTSMFT